MAVGRRIVPAALAARGDATGMREADSLFALKRKFR
jgi:hypothetical protein